MQHTKNETASLGIGTMLSVSHPTRTAIAAIGLVMLFSSPASAGDPVHISTWDHNGSAMTMERRNNQVEIRYQDVSARMRRNGVWDGQVLFEGRLNGAQELVGDAFVFRRGCDRLGYEVRGAFTPDTGQDELELTGAAPVRGSGGCDAIDYSHDRSSARLVFTLIGQDGHIGRDNDSEGQDEPDVTVVPSFDCRPYVRSGQCPEITICSNDELAAQDAMMSRLFKEVLSLARSSSKRATYQQEQRSSVTFRNECGCDFECLRSWYYDMNKSLGKTTVILGR